MSLAISDVSTYTDTSTGSAASSTEDLGEDAFLRLLVTQMQYQDPLDPQENEEFVAQLAQFSQLEQLTDANSSLETLYQAIASMNNASMTQLLGKDVVAYGDTFAYSGSGEQTLHYDASSDVSTSTLTITDENGSLIWSEDLGSLDAGESSISWDGSTISDGKADAGEYTFTIEGYDSDGDSVEVTEMLHGQVDGMSFDTGTPVPSIDGIDIDLGDIIEVMTATEDDEETDDS
jgi:flagellar basal-body rod modification protein FlgD